MAADINKLCDYQKLLTKHSSSRQASFPSVTVEEATTQASDTQRTVDSGTRTQEAFAAHFSALKKAWKSKIPGKPVVCLCKIAFVVVYMPAGNWNYDPIVH